MALSLVQDVIRFLVLHDASVRTDVLTEDFAEDLSENPADTPGRDKIVINLASAHFHYVFYSFAIA